MNIDYPDHHAMYWPNSPKVDSWTDCGTLCANDPDCKVWVWDGRGGDNTCYRKREKGNSVHVVDIVSGDKICKSPTGNKWYFSCGK